MIRAAINPRALAAFGVALSLTLAGCSTGASSSAGGGRIEDPARKVASVEVSPSSPTRTGEVYLMRGLMDIFSRGMDQMAVKLNRAGVYAVSYSYQDWKPMADQILARQARKDLSYPVIIMGHSLGANDASKMATYLGARGVKVSYVVTFDPTDPGYFGKNVDKVVNYYLPNGDNRVYKGSGFKGSLQNISMAADEDITHTTIEKNAGLQARVIGNILEMTKPKAKGKKKS